MSLIIITGMSGAGKSQAVRYLEDTGYYCVDNIPPSLIVTFTRLINEVPGKYDNVAICCDIRGGDMFAPFMDTLREMDTLGYAYRLLFIDASDDVLIRRFKEVRRPHPLSATGLLSDNIAAERTLLSEVRNKAHYIIDTSSLTRGELKAELTRLFSPKSQYAAFTVNVMSFGFKYGIPHDADIVFDVRFLPNPFYIPELRPMYGTDPKVRDYLYEQPETSVFQEKLYSIIDFCIPYYCKEGKSQLVIAIGCTGGRHRSVALAEELARHLIDTDVEARAVHRDLDRYKEST